jgi:hypothetical protein
MKFFDYPYYLNVYYNVMFKHKDIAKQCRLKWDPDMKKWYSKHELYNFTAGDNWIDFDGLCIKFDIEDFKITDQFNRDYPEYNDETHDEFDGRINILTSQVLEKYNELERTYFLI